MKSKYLFWVLLALLLLVLGLVYVLKVNGAAKSLKERVGLLDLLSVSAETGAKDAVGKNQLVEMTELQKEIKVNVLNKLQGSFARRDQENLDLWFPELKTEWQSHPAVDEFQRQYELAADRLSREAAGYLSEQGVQGVPTSLILHAPLIKNDSSTKESRVEQRDEMRRRQREFWVQDHIVRLFARVGAWLPRAIKGGESSGIVGTGASSAAFERTRYDVRVRVPSKRLIDALHALDAPVTLNNEDGGLLTIAISAVIDNVSVRSVDFDLETTQKWGTEPPVEVSFFLTVLDYHERKGR
ncbi:MAG: hypothetical protein ACI97A_001274 [Planctomycetota bacterium]